jgi:hypothetical protein
LAVLAWPEQNNLMLIKLSETHGPSKLDTIGLCILMIGYVPMIVQVIRRLSSIFNVVGKRTCISLILISLFGLMLIALSLHFSFELLLWVSVAISTISQALLIWYAFQMPASIKRR